MIPEDLQEMRRRLAQEHLLHRTGFAPVLEGGRELWIRDLELFDRLRALVVALEEHTARDRGARPFANRLTSQTETNERGD